MPDLKDALFAAAAAGCGCRTEKIESRRGPYLEIMAVVNDVDLVGLFTNLDGESHPESFRHWVADLADPKTYFSSGVEMPAREDA